MSDERKFFDMGPADRFDDLRKRVNQYSMLQLPGQPGMMHMGTSYLVNDLWSEFEKLRSSIHAEKKNEG